MFINTVATMKARWPIQHRPSPPMALVKALALLSLAALGVSTPVVYPPDKHPYETVSVNVSTPTNNAPLDTKLAYYRLNGTNGHSDKLTHSFVRVSCGALMSVHHTEPHVYSDAGTAERPILLLNHGYPESSYIWRKTTAELSKRVPLVVPDVSRCFHFTSKA